MRLQRVARRVAPPARCGDAPCNAAVAAFVEHHPVRDRVPVSELVLGPKRTLDEPWAVTPYTDASEVPDSFERHGVVLAGSELAMWLPSR